MSELTVGWRRAGFRLYWRWRFCDSADDRRITEKIRTLIRTLQHMYAACETKYGKQEVKWFRESHHHRAEVEYAVQPQVVRPRPWGFHICFRLHWIARKRCKYFPN